MSPFPPPPFLRNGVTDVRGQSPLRLVDLLPPCGPRGSVAPRNVRSKARQQFGFTVQLRRQGRYAELPAEAA
jgi:hypothetical protein